MAAERLDLQVSVVSTDNRDLLDDCLASIEPAGRGLRWGVTVVDNASSDGTAEMVRTKYPWAELIRNDRRFGFGANHNQVVVPALEGGGPRYLMILNEDTVLSPDSLSVLVAHADSDPAVGALGPIVRDPTGNVQPSFFGLPRLRSELRYALNAGGAWEPPADYGWLNACCLLLRTAALRQVGALDERFFIFFEDADLGARLHAAGWRSKICKDTAIVHYGHQTVSQPALGASMERQMLRSRYLYFRKHAGRARAFALISAIRGALVLRAVRAALRALVRRRPDDRQMVALLLSLAAYNPADVLPHETPPSR